MKFIKMLLLTTFTMLVLSNSVKAEIILTGMGGDLGLGTQAMPPADDGSSNELTLPFDVNFYGTTYDSFFVNSNGNISLGGSFTRFSIDNLTQPNVAVIAPFFSDINVNCDSENCGDIFVGSPSEGVVVATWNEVAAYSGSTSGDRNTFQAVLIDRSDETGTNGDFDIQFRYESLEWEDGSIAGFTAGNGGGIECGPECECGIDCMPPPCVDDICDEDLVVQPSRITAQVEELQIEEVAVEEVAVEEVVGATYYALPGALSEQMLDLANTSNIGVDGVWNFAFRDGEFVIPGTTAENPIMPLNGSDGSGGWNFNFNVDFDEIVFIDPDVAVGYDYYVDSGNNFASVLLPNDFDADFELWLMGTTGWEFVTNLNADVEYFFDQAGVSEFRILGINTSNMVDPDDTQAFVTGLRFTGAGNQQMRQVAITEFVPETTNTTNVDEPNPLVLLLLGCGFIALKRRKK